MSEFPQRQSPASPPKARPGDRVAVLSPSFAAPGLAPQVHEQAMSRLAEVTGLRPVEFPTTRRLNASAEARAADINAAFADPSIRAILATIGGDDQITVTPHLAPELALADPKPFLGYSDNTHMLNWLWTHGVSGYYGGSTQVHIGAGPGIDEVHRASLLAALITGGELEITDPGESEDVGIDWRDPRALREFGEREATEPWTWAGPARCVSGFTWGGCLEVIAQIGMSGRMPDPAQLVGGVLLVETSEEMPPAREVYRLLRSLGERGILEVVSGVLAARPPVSDHATRPGAQARATLRANQRDAVLDVMSRYNPDAVVCVGVPFGHTRPQWILPYGGSVTLDAGARRVTASYG